MSTHNVKYSIQYLKRTPAEGFYHAESPLLFADHCKITTLDDCPFPLETETFKVLLYGVELKKPATFAVVEYRKACGHVVQEMIRFEEGVKDFDHYGTKFKGESYSIKDWKNRIERFRQCRCEICSMVYHGLWIYAIGEGARSRVKAEENALDLLNWNYGNWQDFIAPETLHKAFGMIKHGNEQTLNCLYDGASLKENKKAMKRHTPAIRFHRGITIDRHAHNGMYSAFVPGTGYVKADTLKGIKSLISHSLKGKL